MSTLSKDELLRYQRHLSLPGFGMAAQESLKAARVLVIGAGGLGCPALQYLAAAGVGTLGVVDDDVVDRSNLQRQILYTDADVGRPKAEAAAGRLRAMNPYIECRVHALRITLENALELVGDYDVVLDGTDNFPTRYLLNDACVLSNKPLVYGALYTFQGQASVFNYKGGPTYRCLFPQPPDPKDAPNCSEIGVLGVLPGMIGMIQAIEAIKVITGIGEPLSGRLLIFDALQMTQHTVRFHRVPEVADVTELTELTYNCAVPDSEAESGSESADEISVGELRHRLESSEALQVVDVREEWERTLFHIDSVHIPLGEWLAGPVDLTSHGLDPEQPTCVYCKAGGRSLRALELMRSEYGFSAARSLRGGMDAWADESA